MRLLVATLMLLAVGRGAHAADITLFSGTLNADGGQSAPLGIDPTLAGPGGLGGGTIEGDTLVTAPFDGTLTIAVTDQGTPGNQYQVILDGTPLGLTSAVVAGGAVNSTGSFTAPVTAGDHVIGLWDFILTYLGDSSPNGGLIGDAFTTPQPVLLTVMESETGISPIPEPRLAGIALLVAGLAAARPRRRARR